LIKGKVYPEGASKIVPSTIKAVPHHILAETASSRNRTLKKVTSKADALAMG
jgi:hypothetical protein